MPGPRQTGNVSMAFQESYPPGPDGLELLQQPGAGTDRGCACVSEGITLGDGMISIANSLLAISRIRKRGLWEV